MVKKAPVTEYDKMDSRDRAFKLFTACEKARKKDGYEAALKVWNEWAMPLMAERERMVEAGEWAVKNGYDEEMGGVFQSGSDDHTTDYFRRANLNARLFIFRREEYLPEDDDEKEFITEPTVKTIICAEIDFSQFTFPANASFFRATFRSYSAFGSAIFQGKVSFVGATFRGEASFFKATFRGNASFRIATFRSDAFFDSATFWGDASFIITTFSSTANFANAKFFASCDFTAIHSERAFDLANAKFLTQVPRFIQAHFSENPRLDHLELPYPLCGSECMPQVPYRHLVEDGWKIHGYNHETRTGRFCADYSKPGRLEKWEKFGASVDPSDIAEDETWQLQVIADEQTGDVARTILRRRPYTPAEREPATKIGPDDVAAYTALRKMALGAQDHETEAAAFKGEMRAKRALSENWTYSKVTYIYDRLFDFGQSFAKPFGVWALLLAIMIGIYSWSAATHHDETHNTPEICQGSEPFTNALLLSANNGLLFAMAGQREFINRAYHCLYGNGEAAFKRTALPAYVGIFGVIHTLLSAILTFFILLALRNRFRIK